MFKAILLLALSFFTAFFISNTAVAQTASDSIQTQAYASTVNNFNATMGVQAGLYNGPAYELYDKAVRGNAYFMNNNEWQPGSVFYDGYLYRNVTMLYDIYKDVVAIELYKSAIKMSLVSEKVKSFDLPGHHFIRLTADSSRNSLKSGFYEQLYAGKITVLAKTAKSLQTTTTSGTLEYFFSHISTDYYLLKDNKFYTVNSESAFINVLKDHKKELQQYIKNNKIKYNKGREQAMVAIAAYYDHLTN